MKKLIILLLAVVALSATARVTTKSFSTPANITAWGTAADTLIASKADTLVLKVTSDYVGKMNLLLYRLEVSGAANDTVILSGSINKASWVALDTVINNTSASIYQYFDAQDLIYNYYRLIAKTTSDTQKVKYYLYGISRF